MHLSSPDAREGCPGEGGREGCPGGVGARQGCPGGFLGWLSLGSGGWVFYPRSLLGVSLVPGEDGKVVRETTEVSTTK